MKTDLMEIKIVIVEDDEIIRNGFVELLNREEGFFCTADYSNCEEAIKNLRQDNPEVILMDIGLPGMSGIEGIRKIKRKNPTIEIIVITVHDEDSKIFQALCAGASGYLTKNISPKKLIESVVEVHKGGAPMSTNIARLVIQSFSLNKNSPLSGRETEILQHLSKGKSYSMIADELYINKETVRTHIYQKLNVHSKASAIEKASRKRYI